MLNAKTATRLPQDGARAAAHGWDATVSSPMPGAHHTGQVPSVHQNMPVSQVMTANVVSFAAQTTIEEATRVLLDKGISGAPVVDEHHHPTGMVSKTDLLEAWQQRAQVRAQNTLSDTDEADDDVHVGDIMVPYLLAISHRAPISLATALMAYEGVQRLVVLGENNKMVGLVTSLDIVRWVAELSGYDLSRTTRLQQA